jgi:putative Mg2+ transporter-C (MgtC) family protein
MALQSWLTAMHADLLGRILIGTALGALIGMERDLHGRPAGLRTHSIVALASATFMVVSTRFVFFQHYGAGDLVEVDASRIAASVVSGIGFLGAGAILRTGITVRGLTTAATLWLVAAIGMAAGGAMYSVAIVVTILGLATLTLLRRFEDRGEPIARQRVTISIDESRSTVTDVIGALEHSGSKVLQQEYERDEGRVRVALELRTPALVENHQIARSIDGLAGVKHLKIERL